MTGAGWMLALAAAAAALPAAMMLRRRPFRENRRGFAGRKALIAPFMQVRFPPGPGPFPAVILLHGCGGVRRIMHDYAEAAVRAGVAAVVVDSLSPRGIGYEQALAQVCTGRRLWGRERAGDLYAALELARADPRIDADRLAVAGWSHGGWTALDALVLAGKGWTPDGVQDPPRQPFKGVRAVLLVYPYAGFPSLARRHTGLTAIPIDAVLVEGDTIASERAAIAGLERIREAGGTVSWSMVSGVSHGYDETDHAPGSGLKHDPGASAQMRAHFVDFLKKYLGDGL